MNNSIAVLIDADNISPALVGEIFNKACSIGEPIVRRAYGMVKCFAVNGGWAQAQRDYGIVAHPQVSNISGKNVADIALVVDAMELLYRSQCQGICIVSNDSDFTAVAVKIREGGKFAYGIGGPKTPESFRVACTAFYELPLVSAAPEAKKESRPQSVCPRCGGKLEQAWTKSNKPCRICASCGGAALKLSALQKSFAAECLSEMVAQAQRHEQAGCVCPDCGSSMSLLKVAMGKRHVEIDLCAKCRAVWYDKDEFESLVPNDGFLRAEISAGKAYRREVVLGLSSDLKSGRRKVSNVSQLKAVLKQTYHVPNPDVSSIISSLMCQKVVKVETSSGKVTVLRDANQSGQGGAR
jgi:Zn-finger nucleic acid-binding protein